MWQILLMLSLMKVNGIDQDFKFRKVNLFWYELGDLEEQQYIFYMGN